MEAKLKEAEEWDEKLQTSKKKKKNVNSPVQAGVTVHLLPRRHLGHEEHQLSENNAGMLQHTHKNANKHTRVNNQASVRAHKRNSQLAVMWECAITNQTHAPLWHTHFTHFKCQCSRVLVQFCLCSAQHQEYFHTWAPLKKVIQNYLTSKILPAAESLYLKFYYPHSTLKFVPLKTNLKWKCWLFPKKKKNLCRTFWHTEGSMFNLRKKLMRRLLHIMYIYTVKEWHSQKKFFLPEMTFLCKTGYSTRQ